MCGRYDLFRRRSVQPTGLVRILASMCVNRSFITRRSIIILYFNIVLCRSLYFLCTQPPKVNLCTLLSHSGVYKDIWYLNSIKPQKIIRYRYRYLFHFGIYIVYILYIHGYLLIVFIFYNYSHEKNSITFYVVVVLFSTSTPTLCSKKPLFCYTSWTVYRNDSKPIIFEKQITSQNKWTQVKKYLYTKCNWPF